MKEFEKRPPKNQKKPRFSSSSNFYLNQDS
jgi:hypothetical protein